MLLLACLPAPQPRVDTTRWVCDRSMCFASLVCLKTKVNRVPQSMYIYIYTHIMCINIYIYTHVYIYIYIYVYIYTRTHTCFSLFCRDAGHRDQSHGLQSVCKARRRCNARSTPSMCPLPAPYGCEGRMPSITECFVRDPVWG